MKGEQIGRFKIAKDFSGNFTRGIIIDTLSGEVIDGNVSDIQFDEQNEKAVANETRISNETAQTTETPATTTVAE
jgi:hypothetical protein